MSLLRNLEYKHLAIWLLLIVAAVTSAGLFISPGAGIGAACASGAMAGALLWYTRSRYRQITDLNAYLKRVNSGDYSLGLGDYDEGELSILRSEIYKVTTTLREQNESLQREKVLLADSLSDISHQLKTPLTSMFMMTDLLAGGHLSETKRLEFTGRISAQLERMQWLVESLLKLSKLDADAIVFKPRSVTPAELIGKACAPLNIPMELKNLTVYINAEGAPIYCDPDWTAEALINILKNCVEHTPPGGCIRISAAANPLYAEIVIRDSGPGIDKGDLPHVFERFYKGKNAGADSVGIGLAMARGIIGAQGGSLTATSKPGGGASFTLRLPT